MMVLGSSLVAGFLAGAAGLMAIAIPLKGA